jgi:dihydroneopterin aldolase
MNRIVVEEMAIRSKLIEQVGNRILEKIKASDGRIERARVKVRKLKPPINGDVDEVSVTLEG